MAYSEVLIDRARTMAKHEATTIGAAKLLGELAAVLEVSEQNLAEALAANRALLKAAR